MPRPPARSSLASVAVTSLALASAALANGPAAAQQPPGTGTEAVLVVTAPSDGSADVARAAAESVGGELVDDLATGGLAVVAVPAANRADLAAAPGVLGVVDPTTTLEPAIHRSVPLVGAPSLWGAGIDGAGQVVVVIDTGVDPTNPAVAPAVVGEACFAGFGTQADNCRQPGGALPLVAASSGAATATPCSGGGGGGYLGECLHGTAVSATVGSRSASQPGVARAAGIYAIQVFNSVGSFATDGDLLLALDHVVDLVDGGMDVAAVNLSLASSSVHAGFCDGLNGNTLAYRQVFAALLARGVPVVAASGNGFAVGATSQPACVSNAVAVGATTLADVVAPFTNRSTALDLLAPGAGTSGSAPLTFPGVAGMVGTSFAAPHVAGALALVAEQFPLATAADRVEHLRRTGLPVPVPGIGASRPRLRLLPSPQALVAGALFAGSGGIGGGSVAAAGDLDGDGLDDVLSHGPGSAPDRVSYGRSTSWSFAGQAHAVAGGYQPLVGDFHGAAAGPDDVLWYAAGAAPDSLWTGNGSRTFGQVPVSISGTYRPLVGDFDGDGWDDVFWYAGGATPDFVWYGGLAGFASVPVSVSGTYRPVVGDFDGDGRDDVFWHGPGAAADHLWRGAPGRTFTPSAFAIGGTYLPVAGDLDGDGRDDIVWYAPGTAADYVHYGGAGGTFASVRVGASGHYLPFVADLDGDSRDDVFWYAPGAGADSIWFGTPGRTVDSSAVSVSGVYAPVVGDWDGDGADDIAWYTVGTATAPVWWSAT